jgi:hypothetical protein
MKFFYIFSLVTVAIVLFFGQLEAKSSKSSKPSADTDNGKF